MPQPDSNDESFCLSCLKKLDEEENLDAFLFGQDLICRECMQKIKRYHLKIDYNQFKIFVLFEEDEWLSNVWMQYAVKGDSALSLFFYKIISSKALHKMKKMSLVEIDNPAKSYFKIGGMYLSQILSWGHIPVFHPYYINMEKNKVVFESFPLYYPEKNRTLFLSRDESLTSWIEWCVFHDMNQILLLMMKETRLLELKEEGAKVKKWLE